MASDLIPASFFRFPLMKFPWEDEDFDLATTSGSGLTVSEDEKNVYVEAAMPGLEVKDIEVSFDKGMLWLRGQAKEEEKGKKYYRRATRAFSYRVAVPGEIDSKKEPSANYKNGVMKVAFSKSPATQPKKITVKEG